MNDKSKLQRLWDRYWQLFMKLVDPRRTSPGHDDPIVSEAAMLCAWFNLMVLFVFACFLYWVCPDWSRPTQEENKAAMKAAMLEALAERFPVFGPRGDKLDITEERRRRDADPTDPALTDRWIEEQKEAEERIREAAEIGPNSLMNVVAVELAAATKRGREMGKRGR